MIDEENMGMHAGAVPKLFEYAAELRLRMTPAEKILWKFLKTKPWGLKFRRQHPFAIYILDFYCHSKRLSIELDGEYHDDSNQTNLDNIRSAEITRLGIREIRFSNQDILVNLEQVKYEIREVIESI